MKAETVSVEKRRRILAEWRESGKSARRFSSECGINEYTFYGWMKAERKRQGIPPAFVEVTLPSVPPFQHAPMSLSVGPYRLEIPAGFDREHLTAVLKVLGALRVS